MEGNFIRRVEIDLTQPLVRFQVPVNAQRICVLEMGSSFELAITAGGDMLPIHAPCHIYTLNGKQMPYVWITTAPGSSGRLVLAAFDDYDFHYDTT